MPTKHFLDQDFKALIEAKSFKDLATIALTVLERMPKPILEVCGPISSGGLLSRERNLVMFEWAITRLVRAGFTVFNQMPFENPMLYFVKENQVQGYNWNLLEDFYKPLFTSGFISHAVFIPNWETSKGANWEHTLCQELSIPITYLPAHFPHVSNTELQTLIPVPIN